MIRRYRENGKNWLLWILIVIIAVTGFSAIAYGLSREAEVSKLQEAYKDSSKILVSGQGYYLPDAAGNVGGYSNALANPTNEPEQIPMPEKKSQQEYLEERSAQQENERKKDDADRENVKDAKENLTNSDAAAAMKKEDGSDKEDDKGNENLSGDKDKGNLTGGQGVTSSVGNNGTDSDKGKGGSAAVSNKPKNEFDKEEGSPYIKCSLEGHDTWRVAEPFEVKGYDYRGDRLTYQDVYLNGQKLDSYAGDRYGGTSAENIFKIDETNVVEVIVKDVKGRTAKARYEFIGDGEKVRLHFPSTVEISLEEIGLGIPLREKVDVYKGDTVQDIIHRAVKKHNAKGGMQIRINYGASDYVKSIYFQGIYDDKLSAEGIFTDEFFEQLVSASENFGNREYVEDSVIYPLKMREDSIYRYSVPKNIIGEFDYGQLSGWMYWVDGVKPNVGIGNKMGEESTEIKLQYVVDYSQYD